MTQYFIDRLGKRHVLYPCHVKGCNNTRPSFLTFCRKCKGKFELDPVTHKWITKAGEIVELTPFSI